MNECKCAFPRDSAAYSIWICKRCMRFYQLRPSSRFFHPQWRRISRRRAVRALRHSLECDLDIQAQAGFRKAFPIKHLHDFQCSSADCTVRHVIYLGRRDKTMTRIKNALAGLTASARQAVAALHLSRKVVAQGATAVLIYVAIFAAHRLHAALPEAAITYAVPVAAGVIAGYLVPEGKNAPHPAT